MRVSNTLRFAYHEYGHVPSTLEPQTAHNQATAAGMQTRQPGAIPTDVDGDIVPDIIIYNDDFLGLWDRLPRLMQSPGGFSRPGLSRGLRLWSPESKHSNEHLISMGKHRYMFM